jgi:hypothetical protein
MTPWRRQKPLHERLAERGGLPFGTPAPDEPLDTRPRWGEVGIHGVHRQRRWDAFATVEAPSTPGDRQAFTALPDGTLLVEDDAPDGALAPLADAVEEELAPPYRAQAVRQDSRVWAVAAKSIEVVALEQEIEGDEVELAVRSDERTFLVDGRPEFGGVPELERLASGRYDDYVVRAGRLDDDLWEVTVAPL